MKRLWLFSCFLFAFSLLYAGSFTTNLPLKEVSVSNEGGFAKFDSFLMRDLPGNPAIPRPYLATFILPDGVDKSTATAYISDLNETELAEEWEVEPIVPDPMSGESYPADATIVDGKNMEIYSSDNFYPANYKGELFIGKQRTVNIATVEIYPYKYNPVTKKLKKIESAILTLEYGSQQGTVVKIPISNLGKKMLFDISSKAVNINNISLVNQNNSLIPYSTIKNDLPKNYVILTTNHIYEKSKNIRRFIESKKERGFNVFVVTQNKMINDSTTMSNGWGGGTGDTAAENIRKWLQENYLTLPIEYLLLVGNPDPESGDVPMKKTWLYRYTNDSDYGTDETDINRFYPTDYYYAELTSDWDTNGDGNYGVGPGGPSGTDDTKSIDRFPDLLAGRFPFYDDNFDNLDSLFRRAIIYENTVKESAEYRKNIFMAMPMLGDDWSGHGAGENVVNEVLINNGYTANRNTSTEPWYYRVYNNTPYEVQRRNDPEKWCRGDYDIPNSRKCKGEVKEDNDGKYCLCIQQAPEDETSFDPLFNYIDQDCTEDSVRDVVLNHDPGVFFWHTHGVANNPTIAMHVLTTSQTQQYFNNRERFLMMGFQASCNNAWPERSDNLAYNYILTGTITTVAATRISGTRVNDTATIYLRNLLIKNDSVGFSWYDAIVELWPDYRNGFAYNIYGDPSLSINTYYDETDSDEDGIRDSFDNCPTTPNSDQINSDSDKIGDACDNCPLVYNPYEEASLADELISGECQPENEKGKICTNPMDGGAIYNQYTYDHGYFVSNDNFPFFSLNKKYMWQPDHDLDGIGDKCDPDYKYVKNNQSTVNQFAGVKDCNTTSSMEICWGDFYINQYIKINNATTISKESKATEINNRFCWADDSILDYWGRPGYCTNRYPDNMDTFIPLFAQNYGYSHGSDPYPMRQTGIESWKEISTSKTCDNTGETYSNAEPPLKEDNRETIKWNWKEDVRCENERLYNTNIVNYKRIEGNEKPEPFFYYTTSAGYRGQYNFSYLIGDAVRPAYFYNLHTYARANRSSASYNAIGYGIKEGLASARFFFKYLYPYPDYGLDKDVCPFCGAKDFINRDLINIWKYQPLQDTVSIETVRMEPEGTVMTMGNDLYKFSRATDNYLYMWINEGTKRSDWQLMAVVSAGSVQPYSATYADKAYVTDGTNLYYMGSDMIIQQSVGTNSVSAASKAVINTAKLYYAAALPTVTNPTLININESLYLLGNGSSVMELYKLSSENQFEKVSSSNAPAIRDRINYSVVNGALYIAGGGNYTSEKYGIAPKTDLWQYTEETGFNQITDSLPEDGIFNLFISATAEKAILFSKQINSEGNALRTEVNLTNGEITTAETAVEGWTSSIVYEENYCIYDTGSKIYPGILKEGECTKLSKYNYDSHTYFDYKKTVAGWNNHLYLGGLSGIREITIEEDGDLSKEKLHWLGNINNIAVKDNYLYGAGGNKIEILKIESDGSLSGKNALSTKDCDNIRIHGSYLIAGENKKVTIWDISTLENPKKVKTISVDYPVKDIETGGNYIYIYHDKLFKTGKLALYDISDILNPVKKDEEKKECNDPELTVSGGEVYMGCKNGQYKAVNSNGSLSLKKMSGEKNYMREAYYYNGVIYQVFSGKLHESK